jgi:hypothetical protein
VCSGEEDGEEEEEEEEEGLHALVVNVGRASELTMVSDMVERLQSLQVVVLALLCGG